jgi:hypothetical protein
LSADRLFERELALWWAHSPHTNGVPALGMQLALRDDEELLAS